MKQPAAGRVVCRLSGSKKDPRREKRIVMEIIVDAYGEEQAMGWYYYLEDKLHFPFDARCIVRRAISPLRKGDRVRVFDMAPEEECEHEMFVEIRRERHALAVPLAQLVPVALTDSATREAVKDWHYWLSRGYAW